MRLDRFISEALGVSRKEATALLRQGAIQVDQQTCKKGATQIGAEQQVFYQSKPLKRIGPLYFMMHKAAGYVCANSDDQHPTVFDLLRRQYPELPVHSCHTVGRLDRDTTGLLFITNDGQWSHRITAPKNECLKVYRAQLAEPIDAGAVSAFAAGLELRHEAQKTAPAQLHLVGPTEALVTLYEGRYHQVKRMFAAVGNRVVKLHREQIGSLTLDTSLSVGASRLLTAEETTLF